MSRAHRPGVAAARSTGETDAAGAVTPLRSVAVRLWAAPASLLGLALAVPWLALGGRMARRDGVLEITAPLRLLWPVRPGVHRRRAVLFDAITFGHVVLARSAAAHDPASGLAPEWERVLSAPFVVNPEYGTRCTTVILLGHDGAAWIGERRFDASGASTGQSEWRLNPREWPAASA